jgi:hypothetical protein
MNNYLLLIKYLINNIIIILYLYFRIALSLFLLKGLTILKNIYLTFYLKRLKNKIIINFMLYLAFYLVCICE